MGLIGHSPFSEDNERAPRKIARLSQSLSVYHCLHGFVQAGLTVVPLDVHALAALAVKVTDGELLHEGGWREARSEPTVHDSGDVQRAVVIRDDCRAALET